MAHVIDQTIEEKLDDRGDDRGGGWVCENDRPLLDCSGCVNCNMERWDKKKNNELRAAGAYPWFCRTQICILKGCLEEEKYDLRDSWHWTPVGTMLDRSVIQDNITKIETEISKWQILKDAKTKGKKITTTALSKDEDDHRSKHLPAKNAKQERKDFNWVVGSTRNIACPNGDGTDGTVNSSWTKRYEELLANPVRYFKDGTSRDYSTEVLKQRASTNTRGCPYMCRTKNTMAKHLLTCKHK